MLLYETYVYTQNVEILHIVENQVSIWLDKVKRAEHNGFLLYPYGYSEAGEMLSYEIDPNQNLEIATIFSYLYWEPKSKFYKEDYLREIAYNEVEAVLSLQKENGSLPLREYLPLVEDSNYGGYSGDLLYNLAQIWGRRKWMESTIAIGEWLHTDFSESHPWNKPEDYPNFSKERKEAFNLVGRILPFYAAGIAKEEVSTWIKFIERMFPNDELNMGSRWYFYQSIPRSYLTDDFVPNYLKPFIYNDDFDGREIQVRIVGEIINKIVLNIIDENDNVIYQYDSDEGIALGKTVRLSRGDYCYNIIVDGNIHTHNSLKAEFTVKQQSEINFNISIFDSNNTFKIKCESKGS